MPKCFFFSSKGSIFVRWSTQTRMSMGSSETEVKELAVMPWILPSSRSTVTTVTPVENWPSALRNSRVVSGEIVILEVFEDTISGGGKAKREQKDWSERIWREKSRFWGERERKAPGWRIAGQRPVSVC